MNGADDLGMATARQFVSITEASRRFGVPLAWLKAEALAGRIPCLRVGRRLLFNVEAVERVLLERAGAPVEGEEPIETERTARAM